MEYENVFKKYYRSWDYTLETFFLEKFIQSWFIVEISKKLMGYDRIHVPRSKFLVQFDADTDFSFPTQIWEIE